VHICGEKITCRVFGAFKERKRKRKRKRSQREKRGEVGGMRSKALLLLTLSLLSLVCFSWSHSSSSSLGSYESSPEKKNSNNENSYEDDQSVVRKHFLKSPLLKEDEVEEVVGDATASRQIELLKRWREISTLKKMKTKSSNSIVSSNN